MLEYRIFDIIDNTKHVDKAGFLELMKSLNIAENFMNKYTFSVKIEFNSFEYFALLEKASNYGYKLLEKSYQMYYTKKELDNAEYYELILNIYSGNDYTNSYQTVYDDQYCEYCGSHFYYPKEPLYINKNKVKKKDISTTMKLNTEIIVSDKLKNLIELEHMTGIEFFPVCNYKENKNNDLLFWHMVITSRMPLIDLSMPVCFFKKYCSMCKMHHVLPISYVRYKGDDLKDINDFNLSLEYFGVGWYGTPKIIIKKSVYELLKKHKIKGCHFEIVGIV